MKNPQKPIVFFSHSSKDEKCLRLLKNLIDEKTKNAIEIFLTSDGKSIPFGKNWVYTIEEALDKSELMFVFISPNSLFSNWLHFEAGYVYSRKDIKVVPVGILGINLNDIDPPLSLIQGFNINTPESLGNIIDLINERFELTCDRAVSPEEYIRKSSSIQIHPPRNLFLRFLLILKIQAINTSMMKLRVPFQNLVIGFLI
jgi:hypothetical protein